jgi:hypothetical protein
MIFCSFYSGPSTASPAPPAPAAGVSINDTGAAPNSNAALDVSSPSTGNGRGMLIPRVTVAQRTTADDALAGGLLTAAGALRGGAAQGLLVYQTDGVQGFYYNISLTTLPDWKFLGAGSLGSQNADAVAITGGTVSSATVTNPTLSGGSIDATPIGTTTPAAVSATTLKSTGTAEVQGAQITLGKAATATAGKLVLHDNDAATASATTIQSASTVSSDFTLTLPANAGAANQVLKTDGTGNLSWTTPIVATGDFKADGTVAMTGDMNMGFKGITNVTSIAFMGIGLAVGNGASAPYSGTAVGAQSNGDNYGAAVGYQANASTLSAALGYMANGSGVGASVGSRATSTNYGASVGYQANASTQGAALGYQANASTQSAALGYKANGYTNGTAIGYYANSGNMGYSVAKGGYSRCTRYNEEWKGADTLAVDPANGDLIGNNKFGYGQVNFNGATTNNTPTEIYLGGTADKRFVLLDKSAVNFQIFVIAINTNTGDTSYWKITGGIKRRVGVATTAFVGVTHIIESGKEGGLITDPTLTADTTYGSLKISVIGVAANTVKWNAAMTYSEVRE